MKIVQNHEHASGKGPEETFTGAMRLDSYVVAPAPVTFGAATVTFEPGFARRESFGVHHE